MTRGRFVMLGVLGVVIGAGALLIPSAGGARVPDSTQYTGVIEQRGVPVTSIVVRDCATPDASLSGTPADPVSAVAMTTVLGGLGATGRSADHIDVTLGATLVGTITALDTPTVLSIASLPCGGTGDFVFTAKKNNGDPTGGARSTATVAFVGSPS